MQHLRRTPRYIPGLIGLTLLLILLLVACQPIVLEVPATSAEPAADQPPAEPGGPPTPFPVQNPQEERWRQETLDDLLSAFAFPDPLPDTPPIQASGTFGTTGPPSIWTSRNLGDDCIIDLIFPFAFTGTVSGTVSSVRYQIFFQGPCREGAPGRHDEVWQATGTFEGTVDGREGTFDFIYVATVEGGGEAPGIMDARIAILRGTGELETLRGVLITEDHLHGTDPTLPKPKYTGLLYFGEETASE